MKSPDIKNDDASTGTIISSVVESDKKAHPPNPVTCDELLAQAVVRSNEQKLVALHERDTALLSAANATLTSNEYMKKLEECEQIMMQAEEKMRILEGKYRQLQIDSEQKIEHQQLQAERLLNSTIEKSQSDIIILKNQTASEIEKITSEYTQRLEAVQHETNDNVSRTRIDAERRITLIQQDYDNLLANLTETYSNEKQRIEQGSSDAINKIQLEMERLKLETENQLSACQMQSQEREDQLLQANNRMKVTLEQRAKKTQLILRAHLNRVQVNAERAFSQLKEDADGKIVATQKVAEEEIQQITSDMESRLALLQKNLDDEKALVSKLIVTKKSLEDDLSKADEQLEEMSLALNKNSNEIGILESKLHEISAKNSLFMLRIHSLESSLLEKENVIQIWESKPKTYVNVSLVKEDISMAMNGFIIWSEKSMIQFYHLLQSEMKYLITNAPSMASRLISSMKYYIQQCCIKTTIYYQKVIDKLLQWYTRLSRSQYLNVLDGNVATEIKRKSKETWTMIFGKVAPVIARINETVKPLLNRAAIFYESKISPAADFTYHQFQELFYKYAIPGIRKSHETLVRYGTVSRKTYHKGRNICTQKLIKGTNIAIDYLMPLDRLKGSTKITSVTLNSLEDIRDHASFYIDASTVLIAVLIILRCRFLIFGLIKTVFRILWFIFPLRFLFTSREYSRDRADKHNAELNGHSKHKRTIN